MPGPIRRFPSPATRSVIIFETASPFCSDDELGYLRNRSVITEDTGLQLDDAYRLAHLPLVAPDHAAVMRSKPSATYLMGRHEEIFSLVLPMPADIISASDACQELRGELERAPFAPKIAWCLLDQRREKLHATVCGALSKNAAPSLNSDQRRQLAAIGPVACEIRGLFSGNVNVGRLYLRLYPERRDGINVCHMIQRILGRPLTDMYLIGVYNLMDHLDANEAVALARILDRWWDRPLFRFMAESLWLLGARDDLVLDSRIYEVVPLTT